MPNPLIWYERDGAMVRLKLRSLTNHEIREVLVGLWSRLEPDDREDHIRALRHYQDDPRAFLSPVAQAIKNGEEGEQVINVDALITAEHRAGPIA